MIYSQIFVVCSWFHVKGHQRNRNGRLSNPVCTICGFRRHAKPLPPAHPSWLSCHPTPPARTPSVLFHATTSPSHTSRLLRHRSPPCTLLVCFQCCPPSHTLLGFNTISSSPVHLSWLSAPTPFPLYQAFRSSVRTWRFMKATLSLKNPCPWVAVWNHHLKLLMATHRS